MTEKIAYLECECSCPVHMIRLVRDDVWNEKTMVFHLVRYKSFWGRLKACYHYLFGEMDLDYDSYLMKPEDKIKFEEWLE